MILCLTAGSIISLPAMAASGSDTDSGSETTEVNVEFANPVTCNTIDCIINAIIDFVFWLAVIIGPLVIIYGGFIFVTAGGDPKKVDTGKKIIFFALIGIGVAVLAKGIAILVRTLLGAS